MHHYAVLLFVCSCYSQRNTPSFNAAFTSTNLRKQENARTFSRRSKTQKNTTTRTAAKVSLLTASLEREASLSHSNNIASYSFTAFSPALLLFSQSFLQPSFIYILFALLFSPSRTIARPAITKSASKAKDADDTPTDSQKERKKVLETYKVKRAEY